MQHSTFQEQKGTVLNRNHKRAAPWPVCCGFTDQQNLFRRKKCACNKSESNWIPRHFANKGMKEFILLLVKLLTIKLLIQGHFQYFIINKPCSTRFISFLIKSILMPRHHSSLLFQIFPLPYSCKSWLFRFPLKIQGIFFIMNDTAYVCHEVRTAIVWWYSHFFYT